MRKSGSIKKNILLIIVLSILIPLMIFIMVSAIRFQKFSIELAQKNMEKAGTDYARQVKTNLDKLYVAVNTYANMLEHNILTTEKLNFTEEQLHSMQKGFLSANNEVKKIYTDYGNLMLAANPNYYSSNTKNIIVDFSKKYSEKQSNDFYFKTETIKKNNQAKLIFSSKPFKRNNQLMVSCAKGITYNNKLTALVGIDFELDWVQQLASEISLYNNAAAVCIVAGNGIIVADNKKAELIGTDVFSLQNISDTEKKYFQLNEMKFLNENKVFSYIIPVKMQNNDVWHVRVSIARKIILKDTTQNLIMRIVLVLILIIIVVILAVLVLNKIISRILSISDVAEKIRHGNINLRFEKSGNDEITILSASLAKMMEKIKEIIVGVKMNAKQLYQSSQELSKVAIKLAEGATEQASSTEEVSASMEEMTAIIEQNAENAHIANKISSESATGIEVSRKKVLDTSKSMEDIANKTSVIDDIAFQTNLLALNAAVEAARAGQYGKGFGVVAAEVRKLAENSKKAAGEIDNLTSKTYSIAKKSAKLLEDIVPEIKNTAQLVNEIANSSLEQKSGTQQINKAIVQLNTITQENVQSAELLATNVQALNEIAEKLNQDINFFKTEEIILNSDEKST